MLDAEMVEEVSRAWGALTSEKRMLSRRVFERTPKERLSPESLEKPEVAEQIEKFGYYDIDFKLQPNTIRALELLTEIGYLDKRSETMYKVSYAYNAHPYTPYISPFGGVGIKPHSVSTYSHEHFDSKEYRLFEETAATFKRQMREGLHRHVTMFEYGLSYTYDTVVYEMKDEYFDAIMVGYDPQGNLIVHLSEPYVTSDGKRDRKTLKPVQEIPQEVFLAGSKEIDKYVQTLDWKERTIGVIMVRDKAYFVTSGQDTEKEDEKSDPFKMPDFFDNGLFSPENFRSRVFEDSAADFLQTEHDYKATARMKPSYLEGLEIDVFAEKGPPSRRTITVCECKLRFDDTPVAPEEVEYFGKKIEKIKENEGRRGDTKFYFWFVTNAEKLGDSVGETAKKHSIELKKARLTRDWLKRADFKIEEMCSF